VLSAENEVEPEWVDVPAVRLEQLNPPLVGDGNDIADTDRDDAEDRAQEEHRRDEAIEADPTRLGRGDLLVPRHVADREDGGDQGGDREAPVDELGKEVDIGNGDGARRETARDVPIELVRQVR